MVDQRNSFTSPTRFASQPVSGIEMAFATPKEVITHVPWLSDEPRFPAIVGIATLAMVESSTCMNVASDSAIVIMTSCAPSSGFRSEEHTSELQSRFDLVCRLLLEKKNTCYFSCRI